MISSHILNTIPRNPKKPIKIFLPSDIFPGYGWAKKEVPEKEKTPDEIREYYRMLTAAMDGREVEG